MGEEEIYAHAERDLNVVIENDETRKVGFDKQDPGDQTIEIYNDRNLTIDQGNETITLKTGNQETNIRLGNQTTNVAGNRTINVAGDQATTIDGGQTNDISADQLTTISQGNHELKVDLGKSTNEAMQSYEIKVGSNSIKIDQTGITIKGMMIKIQGDVTAEMKAPMTTVKGDGMLTLKGGVTMIN